MLKYFFCLLSIMLISLNSNGSCKSVNETNYRYKIFPNGEVVDKKTDLTWMRCSLGQMWSGESCTSGKPWYTWFSWQRAIATTKQFSFADSNKWRVPSILELESIIESSTRPGCEGPNINLTAFPSTGGGNYWSSSEYEDNPDYVWVVDFKKGESETDLKTNASFLVRLVRGKQLSEEDFSNVAEVGEADLFKDDGIHDMSNPDLSYLQRPDQALAHFSRSRMGGVNWVKAIEDKLIEPRSSVSSVEKSKPFELTIVMARTREMPKVIFQHSIHTEWLTCSNCHPAIFQPKVGSNKLSMDSILRGEQCGQCHGSIAFSPMECERCHSVSK